MLNEKENSKKYSPPDLNDFKTNPQPTINHKEHLLIKTVEQIVNEILKKNPRLEASKETILKPIARSKVSEVINKLQQGELITLHDIELASISTFKEALWEV